MGVEKKLPEGWRVTRLGDFVNSKKGKKPKYVSSEQTVDFNIPYVNIKAFEKNIIDEYTNGEGCVFCDADDFLMVWDGSRSGYVGRAIKGAIGSTLVKLSFPKEVIEKYAYYFLQSKYIEINTRAKGVGIPHVDPNLVWNYEFPLPTPKEQSQIVEKIEELFSELDKGIENLKTGQQQLKVYRQAVLKWAFEGKLTNANIKNGELPKGWDLKKLGDVAESCLGKMLDKGKNKGELTPYLGNINVRWNNFNLNNLSKMRIEESEVDRFGIIYGDLIICEGGEPGRAAIWKKAQTDIKFQKALHRVRFSKDVIPDFFLFYLNWISATKQIDKFFTGTTIKHLTGQSLKKIEFPLPSISEQKQIIDEIESRLSVCDKIEETITDSLQQAEALKQSILKRAFEGKLVKAEIQATIAEAVSIPNIITETDWQRKVLAGKIISSFQKGGYIGRTKFQKILYVCENYSQLDYDTAYIQEAAGPLDSKFLYSFIEEAKQKSWIEETHEGNWYKYEPGESISDLTTDYPKYFRAKGDKIQFVIKHLHDLDTDTCELIATIYAIWNDHLLLGIDLHFTSLAHHVYDWSESKAKFSEDKIVATFDWMSKVRLVPVGFGKLIQKI